MASPRTGIPTTPFPNKTAALDASTKELLFKIDDLITPFEELARDAQQCYEERLESDARNMVRNKRRKEERGITESQLEYVRKQAAHLKQQREAVVSQIPADLLTNALGHLDAAEAELDAVLLGIEEQKLLGVLVMTELTDAEIAGTKVDLQSIRDPKARAGLKVALTKFRASLAEFKDAFSHHSAGRLAAVKRELVDLQARRPRQGRSPPSTEVSEDDDDDEDDEVDDIAGSSDNASTLVQDSVISEPTLNSPAITEKPSEVAALDDKTDYEDANTGMFRFDRNCPPTLSRLATWLGLDSDVDVALLLNTWPIQHAFTANRTTGDGQSCVENPERLKMILPLFTYPRETLLLWRSHENGKADKQKDSRLDIPAALFANHVVRFLERSSEVVAWERVSGDVASLGDYELARCRWAVVLQMFWFMEKAFVKVS
ncbi:hypothetical protein F4859DRAFT_394197 [Xylaria cf. heliscus]|nr:hypothetical protein F4859DRAFT_394197 [Xylaria cf. heliscus]